jgi:regulator of replication initiation timing
MNTPTIVFYEHSFDDSLIQSLSKNVLNLGNECRALAEENARLKAENERLNEAIIRGAIVQDAQPHE